MKKITVFFVMAAILALCLSSVASAGYLGTAAEALSDDVVMIKTGLCGEKIRFTDSDFKKALGIAEFDKLTVVTLPKSTEGELMLGSRRVTEGQTMSRRSISGLSFTPSDKNVTESSFTFSIDKGSGEVFACRLRFIEKINYAPSISEGAQQSLYVTTQKGISVFGSLDGSDPEDDEIEYILVSYPKGTVELIGNGEFRYTPKDSFSGKDSFSYVVRDEYGNYSGVATVTVNVTERMSEVVFVDMLDSRSYNAAVSMSAMGIMSGSRLGDDMYFNPEGTVSRAEFVAMAMKALSVKADTTLTKTYFDDNGAIPKSLVSYVATAARCGIVNGSFEDGALNFRPLDPITKTEAAIVMSNLLSIKSDSAVFNEIEGIGDIPVWARAKVGAMYEIGVFSEGESSALTEPLNRESVAEYLYRLMLSSGK